MSNEISSFDDTQLKKINLISSRDYGLILRKYLAKESFRAVPIQALRYIATFIIYISLICLLVHTNILSAKIFISIVLGILLGSITFFLHELMHGSVFKSERLTYLLGLSIGVFNFFPPLLWKRIHNLHHSRTGNVDDPDRSYILFDKPKDFIGKFIYKTRISNEAFNSIISLILTATGFFWYFLGHLIDIFFVIDKSKNDKRRFLHDLFKKNGKPTVVFELIAIFTFQAVFFNFILNGNISNYVLVSIFPVLIAHFVAMLYIHTNHFLSPLTGEIDDPLVNSLSLKNNWIIDKLFYNFSHHVEHHLFPTMNSLYFPKVRELLVKLYPERYQLMPMKDAIKRLFNTPRIYGNYTSLISSNGKKKFNCLLPTLQVSTQK